MNSRTRLLCVLLLTAMIACVLPPLGPENMKTFIDAGAVDTGMDDANTNVTADVLFDFGNTVFRWQRINLTPGNRSAFNATQIACSMLEFELNFSRSDWGVFINGINEVYNAADWSESWSLFIWNDTSGKWELSMVGSDQYYLTQNGSIAWMYDSWGDSPPVPTPIEPNPTLITNDVLIDFGNTTYAWEDVILLTGSSAFNATAQVCSELDYALDHSASQYGIFINGINDVNNALDWSKSWSMFYWNLTTSSWALSPVGCDQYLMENGASIAWMYDRWGDSPPVPTPLAAHPGLVKTDILIDFGNGTYHWEDVVLENTADTTDQPATSRADVTQGNTAIRKNVTGLDAFIKAASELSIELDVTETSTGNSISGVGGINGDELWFWAVLEFVNGSWRYADAGADDLSLKEGVALGLYYTVRGYPLPVANPSNPHPEADEFRPAFTNHSLEYLGNYTYAVNLTVRSDYNLPRELEFNVGNDSYSMTQNPSDHHWWTAVVKVNENFTYHFNSSMGVASTTTATESSPGTRNLWRDRNDAGELESEETENETGTEVEVEVTPGKMEVVHVENPNGGGMVKISVMGNGTLVVKSMDWNEAEGRAGSIQAGFDHLDLFLEITLDELECMDIEIPYNFAMLPDNAEEGSLSIHFWNKTSGKWEKVPDSSVDLERGIILANVTHLTIFAPLAMEKELGSTEESGKTNMNMIIVVMVIIAVVIMFAGIFIWTKRKSADDGTDEMEGEEEELTDLE